MGRRAARAGSGDDEAVTEGAKSRDLLYWAGRMSDQILIVEDERLIRLTLRDRLEKEGYSVFEAASGEAALAHVQERGADLILLDYKLPDISGLDVLRRLARAEADAPVILMTAYSTVESAVEAMRLGAYDYLEKPFNMDEMMLSVEKALETTKLRRDVRRFIAENRERFGISRIIGRSPAILEVFELVKKISRSGSSTILVHGESGTGKDLVAKAIHFESDRAQAPFMNVTCSALPEHLLESELFGHEKGAFTDAKAEKRGLFELARGGSVFLDEVGELPVSLQAKLLRFLEDRTFKRVGGVRDITVDVRVIAATNKDLARAVEEGTFRADLYYRLNVIPIHIPPLRERREDIPLLAAFFIDQMNREFRKQVRGATPGALQLMARYSWPGNVRELKNALERAMILGSGEWIDERDLPAEVRGGFAAATAGEALGPRGATGERRPIQLPAEGIDFEQLERDLVQQALERAGGNQTQAARLLRMTRDQIRYRIEKFGLQVGGGAVGE
jgi:DNA-binding NtrC family response regulator